MIKEQNAIIKSSSITISEGVLDAWIFVDLENGWTQGFGGYALYLPKSFTHHTIDGCAGHFLYRLMEIAGVKKWDEINGKAIRVRGNNNKIHQVGHIIKDDWFCPEEDFMEARKAKGMEEEKS